jgi:hypothetical protein
MEEAFVLILSSPVTLLLQFQATRTRVSEEKKATHSRILGRVSRMAGFGTKL